MPQPLTRARERRTTKEVPESLTPAAERRLLFALSFMVLLRVSLGERLLGPRRMVSLAILMVTWGIIASIIELGCNHLFDIPFAAFGIIVFSAALTQRIWIALHEAQKPRMRAMGISRIALRLDVFEKGDKTERFFEPLICAGLAVGSELVFPWSSLGLWLFCSGLALFTLERESHQRDLADFNFYRGIQRATNWLAEISGLPEPGNTSRQPIVTISTGKHAPDLLTRTSKRLDVTSKKEKEISR